MTVFLLLLAALAAVAVIATVRALLTDGYRPVPTDRRRLPAREAAAPDATSAPADAVATTSPRASRSRVAVYPAVKRPVAGR
jgi:hypothetical protein